VGKFPQNDVDDLLVQCHRRCCICHRFCGVKIELDHIIPQSEPASNDDISNAIPVCFGSLRLSL
jgi:HNH endonuclease